MDLKNLSVDPDNQKATMEVVHPTTFEPLTDEEGNQVTITLHGPDSTVLRTARRKWQNKQLSEGVKRRKMNVSAEQIESQAMELLIVATAGWEYLAFGGEEPECTPANVRKLYTELPWLREQVDEFINERSNFLGK